MDIGNLINCQLQHFIILILGGSFIGITGKICSGKSGLLGSILG